MPINKDIVNNLDELPYIGNQMPEFPIQGPIKYISVKNISRNRLTLIMTGKINKTNLSENFGECGLLDSMEAHEYIEAMIDFFSENNGQYIRFNSKQDVYYCFKGKQYLENDIRYEISCRFFISKETENFIAEVTCYGFSKKIKN
ncbi:MAG: hypothetical protein JEZ07_13950 [Phycisphaerae bacterium]|nr:hypothetical protein [Phycisphaerae bacterium]